MSGGIRLLALGFVVKGAVAVGSDYGWKAAGGFVSQYAPAASGAMRVVVAVALILRLPLR